MYVKDRNKKLKKLIREKGLTYTILFVTKNQIRERILDKFVIWKNQRGQSPDEKPMDLPSHTVAANREFWNNYYDWTEKGEEWTCDVKKYRGINPEQWKSDLIKKMMKKYIKENSIVLEVGPGGGRWTETLQKLSKHLILADITQKCLDICKERFKSQNHIDYKLIKNSFDFLENNSIEYVWSYDVFVHVNPSDIERYIKDFKRILKPGGCAIIHHSGTFSDYKNKKDGWKSFIGRKQFAKIVEKYGMKIIEHNLDLPHFPGDIISVFTKPADR